MSQWGEGSGTGKDGRKVGQLKLRQTDVVGRLLELGKAALLDESGSLFQ